MWLNDSRWLLKTMLLTIEWNVEKDCLTTVVVDGNNNPLGSFVTNKYFRFKRTWKEEGYLVFSLFIINTTTEEHKNLSKVKESH